MSTPPALPPPPKPSNFKAILITIGSAVFIGIGSCWGFFQTLRLNGTSTAVTNTLNIVFAAVFIACVIAFIVGVIWLIVDSRKSD